MQNGIEEKVDAEAELHIENEEKTAPAKQAVSQTPFSKMISIIKNWEDSQNQKKVIVIVSLLGLAFCIGESLFFTSDLQVDRTGITPLGLFYYSIYSDLPTAFCGMSPSTFFYFIVSVCAVGLYLVQQFFRKKTGRIFTLVLVVIYCSCYCLINLKSLPTSMANAFTTLGLMFFFLEYLFEGQVEGKRIAKKERNRKH